MSHQRKVYVVGRDSDLRRLLTQEVIAAGAEAWPFSSGGDFLGILEHLEPACVLLDMDDAEISGLEILDELAARDVGWPVVAVSAREELQLAIEAMKRGALDFLRLPLGGELMALALAPAWKKLERSVEAGELRRTAQERLARLTAREIDVLLALLGGRSNKALAHEFGISVRTVEMHRAHIMAKLEVKSLAEAALLATQSGIELAMPSAPAAKGRPGAYATASYAGSDAREQLTALARRLST
jgi:two-component system, LuxR family, response regulator FixJ